MIYFDNNATTQIAPEVFDAMTPYLAASYGNPSSAHTFGRRTRSAVEAARANVAKLLGVAAGEIVFTSCGTESDNWAILSALEAAPDKRHMITTSVEHDGIKNLCLKLEGKGYRVTWLSVDEQGSLDLDALRNSLGEDTVVVSTMLANNETGIMFPVNEIAGIVKERSKALFHVDGVNAAGKIPIDLKDSEIDLFSISGHKFHGPKGIGALYIRSGVRLPAYLVGGGQESGQRAGTEAVHQIVGIGTAARLVDFSVMEKVRMLRDKLEDGILESILNSRLNGTSNTARRLPNTASISFENTNGEAILAKLDDLEVCVSTGSACSSDNHSASSVLQAMNIPYSQAMGAIRFSLGRYNTQDEVDFVLKRLPGIVEELRAIVA